MFFGQTRCNSWQAFDVTFRDDRLGWAGLPLTDSAFSIEQFGTLKPISGIHSI